MNIIYSSIQKNFVTKNGIFDGNFDNLDLFVKCILEFHQILMNLFKNFDKNFLSQVN